jgi:nucleotide-binding universal stress UspA family protein
MTIVVGYVPTAEGRAALRRGAEEARLRSTRLVVINSNKGGREMTGGGSVRHETGLEEVRAQLSQDGIDHEVRQLVRGLEPADDLIAIAKEVGADLIVIGLRRRTPVGKLVMGSNAQRVLLDAPCPVLAVKAEE